MNKLKIFLILILYFCLNIDAKSQVKKYNIKDYYLMIPENIIGISKEDRRKALDLKVNNGSQNFYYKIHTIDYRNGYIKLSTTGDGGGNIYEMTYYKQAHDSDIILLNVEFWTMCCSESDIVALELRNGEWEIISDRVLPKILNHEFIPDNKIDDKLGNILQNKGIGLLYKLPQKGKNISVSIAETFYEYQLDLPNQTQVDEILNSIKYTSVDLIWDKGKFYIGNKK